MNVAADQNGLAAIVSTVLCRNGVAPGRVVAVHRKSAPHTTTFPCQILNCRFHNGIKLRLFCKYEGEESNRSHGQRRGVAYEAEVYRRVLRPSRASAPAFYGSYIDQKTGSTWLILEYLPKSLRVGKVPGLKAMKLAARWIGRFHAANQARAAEDSFLTVYDAAYYAGWPQRAGRFGDHLRQRFPWLATLCSRLENEISALATLPQTIIHGEYYPHNVMFQAGAVRPVDWETAAIAPGEIDLATLGDGWPPHVIRQLEMEYQRARWPEGAPAAFQRNVDLARIYMHLRWLGDLPEWGGDVHRWKSLHAVGKRLQLI